MNSAMSCDEPARILLVDDEEAVLKAYRRLLSGPKTPKSGCEGEVGGREPMGAQDPAGIPASRYEVTCCAKGEDAVDAVRAAITDGRPYCVAFVDMRMSPGPDGLQTAGLIRAMDPDVHIVLCTAYSDVDPEFVAQRVPPPDRLFYVQKPVHPHELRRFASALSARWRNERGQRRERSSPSRRDEQFGEAERLESVGRLATGVAHGFNNILAIVMGFMELAQREVDPESRAGRHLARALRAAAEGAHLTDRLLCVGRRQRLYLETVDLNAVVLGAADAVASLMGEGLKVTLALDPSGPHVVADAAQLRQIILSLASNARDAMPGGGELTIRTRVMAPADATGDESSSPCVLLELADTGCGMDAETARRAFEPFFTTKPMGRGAGLGLAACHGIVQQLGGDMQLETALGRGTRVRILLHSAEKEGLALSPPQEQVVLPRGAERVLLVEDMAQLRVAITEMLEQLGYSVTAAGDAEEAMDLLVKRGLCFDLLITDVMMPQTDGLRLYQHMQAACPDVKVLFVSGFADLALRSTWPQITAHNFLPKPFSLAQLAHKLREVLD